MRKMFLAVCCLFAAESALGKVDLVTLPNRDSVQLTIYNSADLTLVSEKRDLTLKRGENKLQFSWANTLIDPTSLEMRPAANAGDIDVSALVFPPRVKELGLWNVQSGVSGKTPVEIDYLTSGLSWRAFYMGTLSPDEKQMRLQGYVRVQNNSGEDYANAQTRLIVGKVNLIDRIADLARRPEAYGRPGQLLGQERLAFMKGVAGESESDGLRSKAEYSARKVIKKEGLSEYFLYTIEGRETIPNGWSKRMPSFEIEDVPVVNLYKFEEERYGVTVMRFLSFKNDKEHHLGETPVPGGALRVYRYADEEGALSYEGASSFKYIPVGEDVELSLGSVGNVVVEPMLMSFKSQNFLFNEKGDISGWDEVREFDIEVKNTRDIAVEVEVTRNLGTQYWSLEKDGDFGGYEKVDMDSVRFTLKLEPRSVRQFGYTLTTRHGKRRD